MIRTTALVKRYGRVTAVDRLDLEVREGDRYGFLGPNGSGKTTTVRMLLGLVLPTSGQVELLGGRPSRATLQQVGALVEGPAFYPHLSGRANLRLLDEPTNGLDPAGIREVRELLLALNREGTTVFLSSHLLSEVEALCTRIGVVDRGHLVLQDDLQVFQTPTGLVEVRTPDLHQAATLIGDAAQGVRDDVLLVRSDDPATLNAELVRHGVRVLALAPQRRTLEAAVLDATGSGSDRVAS